MRMNICDKYILMFKNKMVIILTYVSQFTSFKCCYLYSVCAVNNIKKTGLNSVKWTWMSNITQE